MACERRTEPSWEHLQEPGCAHAESATVSRQRSNASSVCRRSQERLEVKGGHPREGCPQTLPVPRTQGSHQGKEIRLGCQSSLHPGPCDPETVPPLSGLQCSICAVGAFHSLPESLSKVLDPQPQASSSGAGTFHPLLNGCETGSLLSPALGSAELARGPSSLSLVLRARDNSTQHDGALPRPGEPGESWALEVRFVKLLSGSDGFPGLGTTAFVHPPGRVPSLTPCLSLHTSRDGELSLTQMSIPFQNILKLIIKYLRCLKYLRNL